MKCWLKEIRWKMNNEVDNVTHNLLSHIKEYICLKKMILQIHILLLVLFTEKFELVFILTQENAFSYSAFSFSSKRKSIYLLMFWIKRFHYNMRCKTKDRLIFKDIYNQCDSDKYISYESKLTYITLGSTVSIFDVNITYFTGAVILEFEEIHI